MKRAIFYEKPGCKGNEKQKALLKKHGYRLEVKSLLDEPWDTDTLLDFLASRPVIEWFNDKAPAIKSGEVDPSSFGATSAISILIEQPILIRRPLIEYDGNKWCGFDHTVEQALGLYSTENYEACLQPSEYCSPI